MHALYTGRPPAFDLYLDDDGAEAGRAFRHPDARRPLSRKNLKKSSLLNPMMLSVAPVMPTSVT